MDDELRVIEQAQAGDEQAKELLLARFRQSVRRAVSKYNCRGRLIDHDDLTQEGMLGLLRAIELFDPARGCKFSHYVKVTVQGWVRHAWERQIRPTTLEEEVIDTGVEQRQIDKQFWKGVFEACLTPRERKIIRLRIWDEFSLADIGDRLLLSHTQVERILGTALLKLKNYLIDNQMNEELGALVS